MGIRTAVKNRLFHHYWKHLDPLVGPLLRRPPPLKWVVVTNQAEFKEHQSRSQEEYTRRRAVEEAFRPTGAGIQCCQTRGFCYVCGRWRLFFSRADAPSVPTERGAMNWREQLSCPQCKLSNRMRVATHLLLETLQPEPTAHIYFTEQVTPFFRWVHQHFPRTIGSEYLGETVPRGQYNAEGIRNEDLTRLTFNDASFDYILCFEVLEHVPDFRRAIAECSRTLKIGGKMLFSVPFYRDRTENTIRAVLLPDGSVQHLLPPEYHGDPLQTEGCLCFQIFGWEMLDEFVECGFSRVNVYLYWSREYGYIGGTEEILFVAHK